MINLYPGPSKLNPSVSRFLSHLPDVVTMNHRSDLFMNLYRSVKNKLFSKFGIPSDYEVAFVSSATECWELVAQSYTDLPFLHVSNGSFGDKWGQVSKNVGRETEFHSFDLNSLPDVKTGRRRMICLTHCETSNGTYLPSYTISSIKRNNKDSLIAVDATASLGGIHLNFGDTDIVFASVQKCLGLPAGMGLLILSPKAIEEAKKTPDFTHYNSIQNIVNNAEKFQTTHTPNILGIYLLNNLLDVLGDSVETEMELRNRMSKIQTFYKPKFVCSEQEMLSPTVMAIQSEQAQVVIDNCMENGIVLGKGYGSWKQNSFRVANFPAHTLDELDQAFKIISRFYVPDSSLV